MNVSISICPTEMEFASGDFYDERKLLAAIREFVEQRHPEATITCLQVGHRQGDGWWKINGDEEAGAALMDAFWAGRTADERLFVNP